LKNQLVALEALLVIRIELSFCREYFTEKAEHYNKQL